MLLRLFRFVFLLAFLPVAAQQPRYPSGYFRNPMDIPLELTANFGELRTNHWHMGLDIRTDARENLPVYAAAGGYIAQIGVRPLSFGRFIIIRHPNGLSTLYAHLNDFAPAIETYVTAKQYEQESWAVELQFNPDQFPVKKGDFLAYSGNTGGSAGPHLHFEIIDTKSDRRLNPLLFGFNLEDEVPPVIKGLAIYDRSRTVSKRSPRTMTVKKMKDSYVPASGNLIKTALSQLSFAIATYDQVSGSPNPNGVYAAMLRVDGVDQLSFVLDSIDYDQTGYINAHIDYSHKKSGGASYQHLSSLPGEASGTYKIIQSDGVIVLKDTLPHAISIAVKDAYGNESLLEFSIQTSRPWVPAPPVSVKAREKTPTHFTPKSSVQLRYPDFELDFPAMGIYDSLPIVYERLGSAVYVPAITPAHRLNDPSVPVHLNFEVRLKPALSVPVSLKEKLVMQRSDYLMKPDAPSKVKKAVWKGNWVSAEFDDFGYFRAFVDTVPPTLLLNGKPAVADTVSVSSLSRLFFTPHDNFGVIKNFRAELNGKWIRFTNDKGRTWIYRFDEKIPYGTHQLTVSAEDLVGNKITRSWWIKRGPYVPPVKKSVHKKKTITKKKKR